MHHARLEDGPLVTGHGRFVSDLVDDDTLHCHFVRSPVAHALIRGINADKAMHMPGIVSIVDSSTMSLPDLPPSPGRGAPSAKGMGQPVLARDRVRYVGEPVAVVVARTARQAADAAEAVWVDYEDLPVVSSVEQSLRKEVLLFPDVRSNIVHHEVQESRGFSRTEPTVTIEVDIPRVSPVTIEPLAILVKPGVERLQVACGHQSVGRLHSQLSSLLKMNSEAIRIIVPDVGGAFGTKNAFYPEYLVVAHLALRLNQGVAWIQDRSEQLASGTHGRGQRITVELTADSDGRVHSAHISIRADIGAYPNTGSRVPLFTRHVAQGPYAIQHLAVETVIAVTNKAPTGPYRGAGRPEAAIAMERAMDALAHALEIDPEQVRHTNLITPSALPFHAHSGAVYDSGSYADALDLALRTADVRSWRSEQAKRLRDGGPPVGIGIGCFVERAGGSVGSGEYGRVELRSDGTIVVRTGSTAAGQGHRTVWSRLAADIFTADLHAVEFHSGDSEEVASGVGSFGSRSAQVGASAVAISAERVVAQARQVAADILEASLEDIELVDGQFRVVGSPGSELSLADVARHAERQATDLVAEEMFNPNAQTFPYGAYVAIVEVDGETGQVDLLSLTAVDDCGNVLDPMIVEGQLHGSIMQGLGTALLEEVVYDTYGNLLTGNLTGYLIPNAAMDMHLQSRRLATPAPSNPLGVKGAGEAGCIGVPPAILNAVYDALYPRGVGKSLNLPLTPARVWTAMHNKG